MQLELAACQAKLEGVEAALAKAEAVAVENVSWEAVMGPLDEIEVEIAGTWGAVSAAPVA